MSKLAQKTDWADDPEFDDPSELPPPKTTENSDGTITTISYSFNDAGQKVRTTRRLRRTVVKRTVNPRIAERRTWDKFGLEKGKSRGPRSDTTTVGENIVFVPSITFKKDAKDEKKDQDSGAAGIKAQLKDKKVKCRICDGDHFTARCPFKDTMAPVGEDGADNVGPSKGATGLLADAANGDDDLGGGSPGIGGLGKGGGGYVPPHLRKGGAATGERMGGRYEKDDLATLRVTNVSESAEENELRDIFERFGRVTRVFLARDKETGRAKGFAFISYQERTDASRALDKLDGYGYQHLILKVEFAKRTT